MNLRQGKVYESYADLIAESRRKVLAQIQFFLLAVGTLEITEHHQVYRRAGSGAVARLLIDLQQVEIALARAGADVIGLSLLGSLAVFGNVIELVFARPVEEQMYSDVVKAFEGGRR